MTTITALPAAPSRADPSNFGARADALLTQLPTTVTEMNAVAGEVNANAATASAAASTATTKASEASTSANLSAAMANFMGNWSDLTGALAKPASVLHSGKYWVLLNDLANVTTSQPGVTGDWQPWWSVPNPAGQSGKFLSNDGNSANWATVNGLVPIGALVAFDSDQKANTITGADGSVFLKTGVVAPSATYPNAPAAPYPVVSYTAPTVPASMIDIASSGTLLVGVTSTGLASTSTDGISWTPTVAVGNLTTSLQIAFGGGRFVVVENNASAKAAWSTDGITWTNSTLPASGSWQIVYGGGQFVACRMNSTDIATSPDGATWTLRTNSRTLNNGGTYSRGKCLAYGAGKYVCVDGSGTSGQGSYSTDGISWTNMNYSAPDNAMQGVTFVGSTFLIYGQNSAASGCIKTSPDGITWTNRTAPWTALQQLIVFGTNGKFFAVGGEAGKTHSSTDGITWTTNATSYRFSSFTGTHYGAATLGTTTVGCGPNGVEISTDQARCDWVSSSPPPANGQIAYGNGVYVVESSNSASYNALYTSTNLIDWLHITLPSNSGAWYSGVAFFAGNFIITNGSSAFKSANGRAWSSANQPGYAGNGLVVAGTMLYSFNSSGSYVSRTSDGITWANDYNGGVTDSWRSIAYGNNTYVLVGISSGYLFTSPNGTSWTQRTQPWSNVPYKVVFAGGYFVVVTNDGNWYRSADGINWTMITNLSYGTQSVTNSVVMTDGSTVIAASGSSAQVLASGGTSEVRRMTQVFSGLNRNSAVFDGTKYVLANGKTVTFQNYVLNDTLLYTSHPTDAEKTNFYKRVA